MARLGRHFLFVFVWTPCARGTARCRLPASTGTTLHFCGFGLGGRRFVFYLFRLIDRGCQCRADLSGGCRKREVLGDWRGGGGEVCRPLQRAALENTTDALSIAIDTADALVVGGTKEAGQVYKPV